MPEYPQKSRHCGANGELVKFLYCYEATPEFRVVFLNFPFFNRPLTRPAGTLSRRERENMHSFALAVVGWEK